jgi:hypothetical protein
MGVNVFLRNFHRDVNVPKMERIINRANVCEGAPLLIHNDSSYRVHFDLGKKNKIHHHSLKEHVKITKIANK